ncbi:MAG TPA: hypothetical protein VN366_03355 [Feifaniaceae bacterium]|nr:hypothetical protein [Feifaniaceae bacterium]
MQGTRLLFRTAPGAVAIPAGTILDLTARFPRGVCVSAYPSIRMASASRPTSNVPVTLRLAVMAGEEGVSYLDQFTLLPGGPYSLAYDVPGVGIKVYAEAAAGTGNAYVDFLLYGYAPYLSTRNTICSI